MGMLHLGQPPAYGRPAHIWASFGKSAQGLLFETSFLVLYSQTVIEIAWLGRSSGTQFAITGT